MHRVLDRVLIFGGGRRVRESSIPALRLLNRDVDIDIVTHSGFYLDGLAYRESLSFSSFNRKLSDYDLIMVSVPPNQTSHVLEKTVGRFENGILIDTPVHRDLERYANHSNIAVLEDIKFLPWLDRVKERQAIRQVIMDRAGYAYHGIALAKCLIGNDIVENRIHLDDRVHTTQVLTSRSGGVCRIREPRDYDQGYIKIVYADGETIFVGNRDTALKNQDCPDPVFAEDLFDIGALEKLGELEDISEYFTYDRNNWIASMHFLKTYGLYELIRQYLTENRVGQAIGESLDDQRIAEKGKHYLRIRRLFK